MQYMDCTVYAGLSRSRQYNNLLRAATQGIEYIYYAVRPLLAAQRTRMQASE